jgi:hypothetical protein
VTQSDLQDLQNKIADALQQYKTLTTGAVKHFVRNQTVYPEQYAQNALECLEAKGVISSAVTGGVTVWSIL